MTAHEEKLLAAAFEEIRPRLRTVAFRLLGSLDDADDAVQDTWLRVSERGLAGIESVPAWLTTVVSRICLDKLKARRRQSSETGQEGLGDALSATLEDQRLFAESVGLAMLVVLERLKPLERVAFVLHEALAVPFDDIAVIVDRSVVATKKLASRARQRVYGAPAPEQLVEHREVIEAFLAAARKGDVGALVAILAPDIVRTADHAARDEATPAELYGSDAVAKEVAANMSRAESASVLLVDGLLGAAVAPSGRLHFVLRFSLRKGRIAAFEVVGAKESLEALELRLLPS